MVLDREAGEYFLRTRAAIFPGMKIAEIFGVSEGPLYEQMQRNILHVNGPDHSRLRSLVNPALSPRAVERYRPAMRGFLRGAARAGDRGVRPTSRAARGRLRVRRGLREALPLAGDRDGDGRAARGRAAPAPLVELDPAAVRRRQHGQRARSDRARRRGVLRVRRSAAPRPPRRTRRGPDLDADRGRRGRASGCRTSSASTSSSTSSPAASTRRRASWRTRSGCWPKTPSSGQLLVEEPAARRAGRRGGAALRADHAVHRAHPTEEVVFRDVSFPQDTS